MIAVVRCDLSDTRVIYLVTLNTPHSHLGPIEKLQMRLFSVLASLSLTSVRGAFTTSNQDVNGLGKQDRETLPEETLHFLRKEIKKPGHWPGVLKTKRNSLKCLYVSNVYEFVKDEKLCLGLVLH